MVAVRDEDDIAAAHLLEHLDRTVRRAVHPVVAEAARPVGAGGDAVDPTGEDGDGAVAATKTACALLLAFLPYLIIRGLALRIARSSSGSSSRRHGRRRHARVDVAPTRGVNPAGDPALPVERRERQIGDVVADLHPAREGPVVRQRLHRRIVGGAEEPLHVGDLGIDGDRKGRAVVRFSKSKLATEIWNDVKDGIRRLVSVGYSVNPDDWEEERNRTTGALEVCRAVKWCPYEISIVSIPADTTVGVGRNHNTMNKNTLFDAGAEIGRAHV